MLRLATLSPKIPRILAAAAKEQDHAVTAVRRASTATRPRDPRIPGNPPLPPSSQQPVFDVKIPDTSHTGPEPPVRVPYLPDFWDSSNTSRVLRAEEHQPKLVVVAGSGTHHGGGPSHNLLDLSEGESSGITKLRTSARSDSFLDDIFEDLQLPSARELKAGFNKFLVGVKQAALEP